MCLSNQLILSQLENNWPQAVEGFLQNPPRSGKADAQVSAGSGSKPARSAGDHCDARMFAQVFAQAFRIIAQASDARKNHVCALRRMDGHARPL